MAFFSCIKLKNLCGPQLIHCVTYLYLLSRYTYSRRHKWRSASLHGSTRWHFTAFTTICCCGDTNDVLNTARFFLYLEHLVSHSMNSYVLRHSDWILNTRFIFWTMTFRTLKHKDLGEVGLLCLPFWPWWKV